MKTVSASKRIAIGAVCAALIVLFLSLSNLFPSLDLTLAAISALVVYVMLLEFGFQASFLVFASSALLGFLLLANKNCVFFYVFFFGWYPFLRAALSKLPIWLSWTLKMVFAACAGGLFYLVFSFLFPIEEFFEFFSPIAAVIYLAVFVLYEIGLSKLIVFYHCRLRSKIFRK